MERSGTGALYFHWNLFPVRRTYWRHNGKGRGVLLGCHLSVAASRKGPWSEEAQATALASGLCSAAYRFQAELAERQPVVKIPPAPGWRTCMCVSYKAVASHFRGRKEFASAGRGGARHSWVFKSPLGAATSACRRVKLVDLQELTVFEIWDLWLILFEDIPVNPSAWRFFCMCASER